jgi:bifunctional DNA-binding transcriptional regulator/antitoxin component of YhaV-PrlF toxin-antitoxin module
MTTTVNVSQKGQMELPEEFCKRKKIKPGTALRITEVGEGLYVAPVPEPTEKELKEVIAVAGSLTRCQTPDDEQMVESVIAGYRSQKRRKRG